MIEILIGLAIIGITSAVALPNLTEFIQSNRITSVSNDLVASLSFARSEAIKRRANVAVCNTPAGTDPDAPSADDCVTGGADWSGGWLVYVNDDAAVKTVLRVQAALQDGVVLTSNLAPTDQFEFTDRGFVFAFNDYQFAICDDRGPEDGRILQVESTGRARVSKFSDTSGANCSF